MEQTTGNLSNKAVASGGKNPAQNVEVRILLGQQHPIDLRTNTGNNVLVSFSATGGRPSTAAPSTSPPAPPVPAWISAGSHLFLDYHSSPPHEPPLPPIVPWPGLTASSGCALLLLSRQAWGHVQISGTRVIYPANAREVTLELTNRGAPLAGAGVAGCR